MAGLYLVGAWLVVQVAETLLPIFGTPDWVLKTLVALLALGFVPALVFSWLYELTPDGLKRDAEVTPEQSIAAQTGRRMDRLIVVGLVAVVALVAADRFWPGAGTDRAGSRRERRRRHRRRAAGKRNADAVSQPGPSADGQKSIAVLPFVNMSADKENEYFSDGISEELLNVLVRVEGIGVASRTSSFAYKGRELGAAAIAKELKVDHILEGSVRKSGNRVRITAQLIDATNDRHLWSETYDRELTDIFAIQDEIANAIVTALRGKLAGAGDGRAGGAGQGRHRGPPGLRALPQGARDVHRATRSGRGRRAWPSAPSSWTRSSPVAGKCWPRSPRVAEDWGVRDRDYTAISLAAAQRALRPRPRPVDALGSAGHRRERQPCRSTGIDILEIHRPRDRCRSAQRNRLPLACPGLGPTWAGSIARSPTSTSAWCWIRPIRTARASRPWRCCSRAEPKRRSNCSSRVWRSASCATGPRASCCRCGSATSTLAAQLLLDAREVPVELRKPVLDALVGERPRRTPP